MKYKIEILNKNIEFEIKDFKNIVNSFKNKINIIYN